MRPTSVRAGKDEWGPSPTREPRGPRHCVPARGRRERGENIASGAVFTRSPPGGAGEALANGRRRGAGTFKVWANGKAHDIEEGEG